jgi:hypothetical protein
MIYLLRPNSTTDNSNIQQNNVENILEKAFNKIFRRDTNPNENNPEEVNVPITSPPTISNEDAKKR